MSNEQIMVDEPASNTADKYLDAEGVTIGSTLMLRERTQIAGNEASQIARVLASDPASNVYGVVVRDVNTSAIVSSLGGTLTVKLDPDSTLGGVRTTVRVDVGKISDTVSVYLNSTAGTLRVKLDPESVISGIQSTVRVDVGKISDTVAVYLHSTSGTQIVKLDRESVLSGIQSTIGVNAKLVDFVNVAHTASIFTVSGSTSGGTTSGVTLISPSASYNYKIFAYSIQSTAISSTSWRFTNGAGSETELWRPLIIPASSSSIPTGANMAVTPPGYIFATGTNTTLALKSDTGSLVHYSVSYIKESA